MNQAGPDRANAPSPNGDGFGSLFEFLPIGAYRTLPDGRLLRVNPAMVRMNGFESEAEHIAAVQDNAKRWYTQPQRRAEFLALMNRDGRVTAFESQVIRYNTGEPIWVSENAHVVRDAQGDLLFYEGTVEDITARKAAEQALQLSELRLQQLVSLIPGVVFRLVLPQGVPARYTFISDHVRALYGLEPAEVLADGEALVRLRHPDDAARVAALSSAALAARRALHYETRIVLRGGVEKWVEVYSMPAPEEDGHPVRVGVLLEVTQRKRAELAVAEQAQVWKRALESAGDGVWDWDLATGIEQLSPACKAMYGFAPDELPDLPSALDERTHPDDLAGMRAAREAHFAGHTPRYENEHRVRCKDGQWKWVLSRGIVLSRDSQGAPLRMIGTHTDVTPLKQAEALRLERDRAAAADLAKSQFLSRVSHELRTPLNAILGFAQLLDLEPGAGARQRDWNQHVLSSGRHLLALMDDILDLSSVQTGKLPMQPEPVSLRAVVHEAWTMLAATAVDKRVTLIDELPAGDGEQVRADRRRLKQIVSNLLSNAIKYNRAGGWVRLSVEQEDRHWALHVADSGPGLDEQQQARLFVPFERAGAERGPVAGTGLGLALARQMAEAMDGSVTVCSEPGAGATFTLRLPAV
jgi:PAS domain S-box-containing protein